MAKTKAQSIQQQIRNIEAHAQALMRIPSGEQFIGNIQAVVSIALSDIARILEAQRDNGARSTGAERR
jgi:hypothetical protein